jgi:hypothetical protein
MLEQTLCFLAEANFIYAREKLITIANNNFDADQVTVISSGGRFI